MRRYETIVIIDPDISEEKRDSLYEKIKNLIPSYEGFLVEFDIWGVQKLAYEIKRRPRGLYVRVDYCGAGDLVDEMERSFRIDDRVLKYLTVLLEKETDVDQLKEDMAREAEEEARKEAEREAAREAVKEAAVAAEAAEAAKKVAEAPAEIPAEEPEEKTEQVEEEA